VLAWLGGVRGDLAHGLTNKPANEPLRASVFVMVRRLPFPGPRRNRRRLSQSHPCVGAVRRLRWAYPCAMPSSPCRAPGAGRLRPFFQYGSECRSAADPAAAALPGDLLASSKAMAGWVDRELRKGIPPIMAEPERKWERCAKAFADARKGAANTVTLDSYTAPDGVVLYRKTSPDSVS
jgi:hypothetical protein